MKKIYYPLACCLIGGMLAERYGRSHSSYYYCGVLLQVFESA